MDDREKVINGLKLLAHWPDGLIITDKEKWIKPCCEMAIALLKDQEPVKPEREYSGGGTTWWNICGACRTAINPNDKYCHECGRAVKWE